MPNIFITHNKIVAVMVSVVALIRTRSVSEQIHNAEIAQSLAKIKLELQPNGQNYKVHIISVGHAEAINVNLKLSGDYNPLSPSEEYEDNYLFIIGIRIDV